MNRTIRNTIALALVGLGALAVETQTWQESSEDDFAAGTLDKLSLRSDGRLTLAPAVRELLDSSMSVLWAVAEDSQGNVYCGGGGPGAEAALVFRLNPAGESQVVAKLDGLAVQAIAIDSKDTVYAATSPDGAVYKITAGAEPEIFFKPETKYIWALQFGRDGALYVGTGDTGQIFKVTPDGQGSVFFDTEETHVRSLALDGDGNLIAGTEPGGLILRISDAGDGFVLHQSSKREITAVTVDPKGRIWAAGVGSKAGPSAVPISTQVSVSRAPAAAAPSSPQSPQQSVNVAPQGAQSATPVPQPRARVTGGSELVRIDADGYPRVLWSDDQEVIYSIAIDAEGRPVIGTGNDGRLYRLDSERLTTLVEHVSSAQVTSLVAGRNGRFYATTGNIGKLYAIGPELAMEGTFESDVLDAEHFSYWGRIRYTGEAGGGEIALATRSGNLDRPQQNWSGWADVALSSSGGPVKSPAARFLQYRLTLKAGGNAGPEVREIDVAYQLKNVAPTLTRVVATPPNYRFPPQTLTITPSRNITLTSLTETKRPASPKVTTTSTVLSMQYDKGYIGARWLATDDNGDTLRYKLEIRGVNETEWKLLADDLGENYYSWDSTAFTDGEYQVRVTATDAPSNTPREALAVSMVGDPFLIDNTPPRIEDLKAEHSGVAVTLRWRAIDGSTVIGKAEYSLDGGDWTLVEPTTRLSDARQLDYELTLPDAGEGEHTIAVRITDSFENQSVAKAVVR